MSKRISREKARKLRELELKSQELNKQGIRPNISRKEKRRRMKMSKAEKFLDMLWFRGGHYKQKEPDKNISGEK